MVDKVHITARVSDEVSEKFHALAERRYGSRSQESYNRLAEDIIQWKMKIWDRYGISLGDWFWVGLAYKAPLRWLKRLGWGKLIDSYFSSQQIT